MKATTPGPVQTLRDAIAHGEITPRAAAEQALARANSNASRNVYLSLDADAVLREADALPRNSARAQSRRCTACRSRSKTVSISPAIPPVRLALLRRAQRHRPRRLRRRRALARARRNHHREDPSAPIGVRHHGRKSRLWGLRAAERRARLTGGSSSGSAASVQEGSAVAAIGTDTGGSIRAPAALCGLAGYRASIGLAQQRGLWQRRACTLAAIV